MKTKRRLPPRARAYAPAVILVAVLLLWGVVSSPQATNKDFSTYYAAATQAIQGHASEAYDLAAVNDVRHQLGAAGYQLWSYPPDILLLTTPFAHLPFPMAYGLWAVLGTVAYLLVLRAIVQARSLIVMALSFPAYAANLNGGQNGAISMAILGTGMLLLDSRPIGAGLTLGALTYKPQLAALIPVVLLATGRWRQLFGFVASATALAAISAAFFGLDTWVAFFQHSGDSLQILHLGGFNFAFMPTVTASQLLLDVPFPLALTIQMFTAGVVAVATVIIWRSDVSTRLKAASLPPAILLCTPYAYYYDLLILAVSAAFIIAEARETQWLAGEKAALAAVWAALPAFMLLALFTGVQVGPLFVAIPLLLVSRRALAIRRLIGLSVLELPSLGLPMWPGPSPTLAADQVEEPVPDFPAGQRPT